MTESRRLVCIAGGLAVSEVESRIGNGRIESLLYYPYYSFLARVRTRPLTYLLDGRTGRLSTADPFAVEWVEAPERDVLGVSLDEGRASTLARRYVAGRLVAAKGLVHKTFWILSSDSGRFLLDAQSAGIHPLPPA